MVVQSQSLTDTSWRPNEGDRKPIVWWEVEINTQPIIGMDNFDKLGMQMIECPTNGTKYVNSGKQNQVRKITKEALVEN